uniref:tRNA pseudouridine synthase n=1 Tax=Globisporangium ultimum (strain ATCC 200006 / CBS 805.95 / DAOM BR144) TaxID=431595 RepID=K3WAT4_GLOUD
MAGKRKTHWAVRRKNKQARGDDDRRESFRKNEHVDRREGFPEEIHPGSYAALRKVALDANASTAGGDAEDASAKETKRRYGIWLAFCGKNYSGMQMNEGVKTIEAELERALFEAGGISEANYGFLQKVGWSRAARTDKGVHAAGQLLTAKLHVGDDIPAFVEKVNAVLPEDIRVMKMVTVTKNFNAKMSCDQRTYEYLAPTFIFGKRSRAPVSSDGADSREWPSGVHDTEEGVDMNVVIDDETLKQHQEFRMDDDTYELLNKVLGLYKGTHNFHNFTSKLEPTSPKCKRFIISFSADKPFVENNMEWIRLRVVGQSFLLHHIRKMIGATVDIVAGVADISTIEKATQLEKMDLPKAPSVGLYLAQAHFEVYNMKMQDSIQTSHPPLVLDDVKETVEKFKRDFIFDHIIKHEEATRTYAKWVRALVTLPFDYQAKSYAEWKKEKEDLAYQTDRAGKRESAKAQRAAEAAAAAASSTVVAKEAADATSKVEADK